MCVHTVGMQECGIELSGQQRIRHVPQELFEKRCHIVDALLLVQLDIHPHVKVLPELVDGETQRKSQQMGKRYAHINMPRSNKGYLSLTDRFSQKQDFTHHQLGDYI